MEKRTENKQTADNAPDEAVGVERMVSLFMAEINMELGPILTLVREKRPCPCFSLHLRETPYALANQVVPKFSIFNELVQHVSQKYFKTKPMYNNTGTTFWFIEG